MDVTPRPLQADAERPGREELLEQALERELPRFADALRRLGG